MSILRLLPPWCCWQSMSRVWSRIPSWTDFAIGVRWVVGSEPVRHFADRAAVDGTPRVRFVQRSSRHGSYNRVRESRRLWCRFWRFRGGPSRLTPSLGRLSFAVANHHHHHRDLVAAARAFDNVHSVSDRLRFLPHQTGLDGSGNSSYIDAVVLR